MDAAHDSKKEDTAAERNGYDSNQTARDKTMMHCLDKCCCCGRLRELERDSSGLGKVAGQQMLNLAWLLVGVAIALYLQKPDVKLVQPAQSKLSDRITAPSPSNEKQVPSQPVPVAPPQSSIQLRAVIPDEKHPDKNIRRLPADLSEWQPGEMGLGVEINEDEMPEAERGRKQVDAMMPRE